MNAEQAVYNEVFKLNYFTYLLSNYPYFCLKEFMDKVLSIDELVKKAAMMPKSLKSALDEISELYNDDLVPAKGTPKGKRRKTDRRTLAKRRREYENRHRREKADEYREKEGSLRYQFFKLRREMLRRARGDTRKGSEACWDWNLSLDEWIHLWLSCPKIDLGNGVLVDANTLRGRKPKENVQLRRIDPNKPFEINNLVIMHGKKVLYLPKQ